MIKGFRFIGLDIETTGTDPTKHELIQIGIMPFHSWRPIVHDVLPLNDPYQWEQEALDINKFTHERIRNGRVATSIDNELYEDLSTILSGTKDRFVPVGYNVGSFDMQFFRRCFPKTMQLFSYRTFDLNVLVFTLADVRGKRYDRIKRAAKRAGREYAANQGMPDNAHDAGYDAAVAVGSYNYLTDQVARAYSALQGIRAVAEDVLVP